ncbi:sensor domain-containing protein [Leptolyngbya iicbica]|uniref:Bifunctional diguanylate cyclase/phosphodiesterase n=2 Tax=Cyanophyceae TaxID=3028117 RepID=A0A4Q7EGX3_9CYAN|nr:bifunctional diguanylate cyclase/phosphodiesterase [Leptolyngbya sp. LK]RZM82871.1 bifunctional diguanylate cyclase/phosphodiesterase [Leptolyngbya sp. LK]
MDIFKSLFDRCCDAVVIVNEQAELIYANLAACQLLDDPSGVLTAMPGQDEGQLWEKQQGRLIEQSGSLLQAVLAHEPVLHQEFLLQRSHTATWLAVTSQAFHLPSLDFHGVLLLMHEVNPSPDSDDLRSSLASRDVLASLINRSILMDRIQQALQQDHQTQQGGIAILCVDITRLKTVNDAFGYLAGDRLLVEIVARLSSSLRPKDVIARLGGDEFIVLLEDIETEAAAIAMAEALHAQMATPFVINGCEIGIGLNIGISLSRAQILDADTLLRQADRAMTEAKCHFGERYRIFAGELTTSPEDTLHLEMSLKQAIEKGEMYLEYQPMVLVRMQEIIGVESLVRWQHPEQGSLSPGQFINIAERTGLIIPLGWWVLEESCRQLKEWQETIPQAQNLFVSVNMSSQQFAQPDVLDRIKAILQRTRLSPQSLKIEMTESVLINNSESIIEILAAIRDLGIRLSVDDFGTGYSSLSYLHRFPVDTLKIDRSFLENADSDYEKLEILQSVVRLAWNLGLEVVAEGIETPKHLAQVQALRCESGQGFLFSRPLNKTAMEAILQSQATAS